MQVREGTLQTSNPFPWPINYMTRKENSKGKGRKGRGEKKVDKKKEKNTVNNPGEKSSPETARRSDVKDFSCNGKGVHS